MSYCRSGIHAFARHGTNTEILYCLGSAMNFVVSHLANVLTATDLEGDDFASLQELQKIGQSSVISIYADTTDYAHLNLIDLRFKRANDQDPSNYKESN